VEKYGTARQVSGEIKGLHMGILMRVTKATNKHSEYKIHIACTLRQLLLVPDLFPGVKRTDRGADHPPTI
jgi:hypothetical protein